MSRRFTLGETMEWKARECLRLVDEFIKNNRISCAETVYQMDHVIENAYEFIEGLCDVAGYFEDDVEWLE